MRVILLFACFCFLACRNTDMAESESNIVSSSSIIQNEKSTPGKDSAIIDSITSIPETKVSAKGINQTPVLRTQDRVSDENLNGKSILIQLDLSKNIYFRNPDTIISFLNQYYSSQEQYFPRAIADDLEHGVSTEHIHFPTLKFVVELFENKYETKPYKIVNHTIFNETDLNKSTISNEEQVYENVDVMPVIANGNEEIRTYIENHVSKPQKVKTGEVSGISWLTFIVEKDGSVSNLQIAKDFINCKECDIEVLRVANSLPKLNPGKLNGNVVRVKIFQGFRF
jgi:hypothetical protein